MSDTSRKSRPTSRKRRPISRKRCATSRKRRHRHSKKRRYRHSRFEEACNQADAEQARRLEPEEVARLARLSTLEYDRQREEAAERLGVRVGTLDKAVWKQRASADNDDGALPHWKIEPSPEPVDGAKLLNNLRQVFRRYIVLPKGADVALALWTLGSLKKLTAICSKPGRVCAFPKRHRNFIFEGDYA
jgi:hypothetical protein